MRIIQNAIDSIQIWVEDFASDDDRKQIVWPPDNDVAMSVRSFADASANAVPVKVNDKIVVPVVSPQGLFQLGKDIAVILQDEDKQYLS